jgi:hypothetical protein
MKHRALVLGLVLMFACGKDGGVDSGLPPDQPGSALTPTDQAALCGSVTDYVDARISAADWLRYACTLEAIGEGAQAADDTPGRIAACEQSRDACVAAGNGGEPLVRACDDDVDWSMCSATVGEIEACFEDALGLFDGLLNDFTCEILDPARAEALQAKYGDGTDALPPSCEAVEAKCPGVLGGDDDEDEVDGSGSL